MVNYINEASIKDADKLSYKGNEVRTTRKGADIANAIRERNRYNDLIEDGYDVKKPNLPIDIDKNKPIEADRKRDIKASTRNKNHVVPDVGANPSYSKDADTKAVQRFKEALKNKDIDINKSLENIPDSKKKDILKDRIKSGKKLPDDIAKKLVRKDDGKLKGLLVQKSDSGNKLYARKDYTNKNDPEYIKLRDIVRKMKDTNDHDEYKKLKSELLRLTGFPKNTSIKPEVKNGTYIAHGFSNKSKDVKISTAKDLFYHGSQAKNLKALTPSFKSSDNDPVFYDKPRTYFMKNNDKAGRIGSSVSGDTIYKPTKTPKFSGTDQELQGTGAVYVNSKKEIPVTKSK